jgi:hypothetical protein
MAIIKCARTSLRAFRRAAKKTSRRSSRLRFDPVQENGQALRKVLEIPIRGKDRQIASDRDRANKEVGVRALDALGPAKVEKIRGRHVILRQKRHVGERRKVGFQPHELRLIPHAGEDLLPHRPDDYSDMSGHEPPQFFPLRVQPVVIAAQRQGPDARINEHPHVRARWRL